MSINVVFILLCRSNRKSIRLKVVRYGVGVVLHDMRVFAGELVCADIFTDHRLMLGVGRGAFGFEMERMGVPIESSREKFDESLNLLQKLLSEALPDGA